MDNRRINFDSYYDPPEEEGEQCPKCGWWLLFEEADLIPTANPQVDKMIVYWQCDNCGMRYEENPNA